MTRICSRRLVCPVCESRISDGQRDLCDIMRRSKSRFVTAGIYDQKIRDQRRREVLVQATTSFFADEAKTSVGA